MMATLEVVPRVPTDFVKVSQGLRNQYGTLVEYKLTEKYGIELQRTSWCDGVRNASRN
jgi:hypothetical protein